MVKQHLGSVLYLRHARFFTLILFFCSVAVCFPQQAEPTYGGKAVTEWLMELDVKPSLSDYKPAPPDRYAVANKVADQKKKQAEQAIRYIGKNGLPVLLKLLGVTYSNYRTEVPKFKSNKLKTALLENVLAPTYGREIAVAGFAVLGKDAQPAIPHLDRLLHDENIAAHAARALCKLGPPALPALTNALTSTNRHIRKNVLLAIAHDKDINPAFATGILIHALNDTNWHIRTIAAESLAGRNPMVAVPALGTALDDEHFYIRSAAATALGTYGPIARNFAPKLLTTLKAAVNEPDQVFASTLGDAVVRALEKIDPATAVKAKLMVAGTQLASEMETGAIPAASNRNTGTKATNPQVIATEGDRPSTPRRATARRG